ncbi:MAG: hypothetical protein ACRDKB_01385 [Actinomycetota bacterium]
MLCLGVILDSLPPQCGDVPITNWSWNDVDGEEQVAGTTWGEYHVVGTFDGESFTVTEVGPPRRSPSEDNEDAIDTPCPEPDGGWQASDPDRVSDRDWERTAAAARKASDFAGVWIDHVAVTDPESGVERTGIILNVAFTGDLERHEAELRETWGGPLCVVEHPRTLRELRGIQRELGDIAEEEFELQILWSSSSEVHGVVEIGVVTIDAETRAALDERYGTGAVEAEPALRPVP